MGITRRDLLQTVGAAGLATLAGASRAQAGTLKISHQFPGATGNDGDFRDRLCKQFAADAWSLVHSPACRWRWAPRSRLRAHRRRPRR